MEGKILLHPMKCPKDVSINRFQEMHYKACHSRFKDLLNIDKCVIACRNPDNLRRLVAFASLKPRDGNDNKVAFCADNMKMQMIEASTIMEEKTSNILKKEKPKVDRVIILSAQLRRSRGQMCNNAWRSTNDNM